MITETGTSSPDPDAEEMIDMAVADQVRQRLLLARHMAQTSAWAYPGLLAMVSFGAGVLAHKMLHRRTA